MRIGYLTPYFQNLGLASGPNRSGLSRWQLYATGLAEGRVVGYNATMQGGLFNRRSPYTLASADLKRVVAQGTASVVAAYGDVSFRTSAVWITPEFRGSRHHAWVQFGLGVAF
ncbi:lipid A deacylase LpxR family protein [Hymenobacter cellulosilyticus]|uniref:lipid A deacylase LpxR family protein n=1 Tax=Hymenobacter cellulosilyticus TaxID=2932248 RepID=UPI0021D3FA9B|nr:lipid A deacylase LpxR family protein [Hymenobacter cellulosilyticus]